MYPLPATDTMYPHTAPDTMYPFPAPDTMCPLPIPATMCPFPAPACWICPVGYEVLLPIDIPFCGFKMTAPLWVL